MFIPSGKHYSWHSYKSYLLIFYGGAYCAWFEPLTKWYPTIVESAIRDLKEYISKVDDIESILSLK